MDSSGAGHAVAQLRCIACGGRAESPRRDWRCAVCGDLLEAVLPLEALAGRSPAEWREVWRSRRLSTHTLDQSGVWRFRELLPILRQPLAAVTLREGNTPMYSLPTCARAVGLATLWAKHLGMNPTGSFKDLGMTAAVSRAREEGSQWLACASTGNTAAATAAYAARAGMQCLVLVPEGRIAWAKLAQALDYGALTCQLRTDFDGCVRVLNDILRQEQRICVVNSVNPYRLEGQKTAALEMLEALDWRVPDHVVVPGGNLANASALGKAFAELAANGFIERMPTVSIVQAEGANPLVRCLREHCGRELAPVAAETRASAIRIGNPASWKKAVRVLAHTGGTCLDVTEAEIAEAKFAIGREGVGCEPASAAALAGVGKLVRMGAITQDQVVVIVLTGHVLKDTEYTLELHAGKLVPPAHLPSTLRSSLVLDADPAAVLAAMEKA